jgi:plasmid stabilization system protein ParE
MINFDFHPEARVELRQVVDWFEARSLRTGQRFALAVEDAIQKITAMPHAYPAIDRRHRMFKLKNYPYYLVYREEAGGVLIVAVADAARQTGYWKGR